MEGSQEVRRIGPKGELPSLIKFIIEKENVRDPHERQQENRGAHRFPEKKKDGLLAWPELQPIEYVYKGLANINNDILL